MSILNLCQKECDENSVWLVFNKTRKQTAFPFLLVETKALNIIFVRFKYCYNELEYDSNISATRETRGWFFAVVYYWPYIS